MEKTVSAQRPALGKGLASLLANAERTFVPAAVGGAAPESGAAEKSGRMPGITMIDIDSIEANVFQPRRDFDETALNELSESIEIPRVAIRTATLAPDNRIPRIISPFYLCFIKTHRLLQ